MKILCTFIFIMSFNLGYSQEIEWIKIPKGEFIFGEDDVKTIIDYDYYIMKYEVSNELFVKFLNELLNKNLLIIEKFAETEFSIKTKYSDKHFIENFYPIYYMTDLKEYNFKSIKYDEKIFSIDEEFKDHPVILATWFGAKVFAQYYGYDLPNEKEWEKAARGINGNIYPWGNQPEVNIANYWNSGDPFDNGITPVGYFDGTKKNGYQTKNNASPYGVMDLAGNVWEWTNDYSVGEFRDKKIIKGGSWYNPKTALKSNLSNIYDPLYYNFNVGFRCIKRD